MTESGTASIGGVEAVAAAELDPHWFRTVALVTVIAAISVTAAAMARPMVTYRAIGLGGSPLDIGLVQSAYSVLPMATAIAVGRWTDRVGEARLIALGCIALAIGAVALAASSSLIGLAIGQILMGFGVIATAISTQALIANRGPAARQVHRFGWFSVAVSAGQIAGPALAALLASQGGDDLPSVPSVGGAAVTAVFVASAVTSCIALGLVRTLPPWRGPDPDGGGPMEPNLLKASAQVVRRPGIASAMFVSLAVASALDVLIVYLPAYGEANGLTLATVGALLAIRAAATLVSRTLMARLTDRLGLGGTLVITTGVAALSFALFPFVASVPLLFVLAVLIGLGLGIGQPLTVAWISIQSPANERGLAFGVRHTGNLATLVVVPVLMGLIAGVTGIGAVWFVLAAFLGTATLVAARTRYPAIERRE